MGAASPAQVRVDARGETGSHREGWVGARGKTLSHGKGIELDTGEPGRREELSSLDSPRADSTIRTPPTNRSLGPPLTQTGMEPSPRFEEPSQECETDEPSPTLSTPNRRIYHRPCHGQHRSDPSLPSHLHGLRAHLHGLR